MRPKTYAWAKRGALVTYKKALKAAEKGDWEKANSLINRGSAGCGFCQVANGKCPGIPCPVHRLCGRAPNFIAWIVRNSFDTASWGIRRLRSTIAQLEKLEVA